MTRKSLHDRYADLDPKRIVENPRDEQERSFSENAAANEAKRIWDGFGKSENHRRRVITLLAKEALNASAERRAHIGAVSDE
jgi:hypothetical protein